MGWRRAVSYRRPMPVRQVFRSRNGEAYPVCPRCCRSIDREFMRFCDRCGQRLGWRGFSCAEVRYAPLSKEKRFTGRVNRFF